LVDVARVGELLPVRRNRLHILAAEIKWRHVVIAWREIARFSRRVRAHREQVAALMFRVGSPMPVEQLREDFCLYLALAQLFIAPLVFGVVLRLWINRRQEHDVLSVRRPDAAVSAGGKVGDLMRLAVESAAFRSEIAHPDLRWVGRL